MCCFSGPVEAVSDTSIFVRAAAAGRQFVVYEMTMKATAEVAMILPIPVPKGAAVDAVRFISLEDYPKFFADLHREFSRQPEARGTRRRAVGLLDAAPLPVVAVGAFAASFVPSISDFSRLDARFRLPETAWARLPAYRDFGFAVFKLRRQDDPRRVHPMAFEFPRADPRRLFFPTVHIHDGQVHDRAHFDHALYCQATAGETLPMHDWVESPRLADQFMQADKTSGIVDGRSHCHRRLVRGMQRNEDIVV